ncbi:MAG: hypothetical protein ACRD1E_09710, partial [Terriglobales bacterium]
MVVAALGRTANKSRETDARGQAVEDWIYGEPPAATTFVRFTGGRVTRVTTYRADGTQVVDSTPDPALTAQAQVQQKQAAERAVEAAQPAPTLRRPGDAIPDKQPSRSSPPAGNLPPNPSPNGAPNGLPPSFPPGSGPPGQQGPPAHPPVCCGARLVSG